MSSTAYRPDIDGLRAVAVLSVLLFHGRLRCPGGFVGVDVFFVISGYLISSLILNELEEGTFSLARFWERRVRRILPALTALVFAVFLLGWLVYLPTDYEALGRSIQAQATLLSNVYFYLQPTGYFDAGTDTMPLLHTWSLAVEEQFYVVFPVVLVLLSRQRRVSMFQACAALATISFMWSVVGTASAPRAAFYLLPARAWELLLGALLAISRGRFSSPGWKSEVSGAIGLALIVMAIFLYDGSTPFPGFAAIPPCLGAALVIHSSESRRSFVGRLLAIRPAVAIGLISYSLYLWHWPMLVLAQYLLGNQRWPVRASMLGISLLLAVLSWRFVETPFRRRELFSSRSRLFAAAGATTALAIVAGLIVRVGDGLPFRFSDAALRYADGLHRHSFRTETTDADAAAGHFAGFGLTQGEGPVDVLIWGDSHAMGMTQALDDVARRYELRGLQATRHWMPPLLEPPPGPYANTEAFGRAVFAYLQTHKVDNVVLTAHWKSHAEVPGVTDALIATVQAVMRTGARVIVVKDVPDHSIEVPKIGALREMYWGRAEDLGISPAEHERANAALAQTFTHLSQMGAGVVVLDPATEFLDDRGLYAAVRGGRSLYMDGNHLSIEGARVLVPLFESVLVPNGKTAERP